MRRFLTLAVGFAAFSIMSAPSMAAYPAPVVKGTASGKPFSKPSQSSNKFRPGSNFSAALINDQMAKKRK